MNEWIPCKKQMPEEGEAVLTKTRSGVVREGIWVEMGKVCGWLLNVTGPSWRRNPGEPIYWREYTPPQDDF